MITTSERLERAGLTRDDLSRIIDTMNSEQLALFHVFVQESIDLGERYNECLDAYKQTLDDLQDARKALAIHLPGAGM